MAWWNNWVSRINESARATMYNWLLGSGRAPSTSDVEASIQDIVTLARRYYDGDHILYMTKRQKAWLNEHGGKVKFTVNHCPTVVDALVERLKVLGFRVPDNDEAARLLWRWWNLARMDAVQIETHRAAARDGEAFLLVSWNADEQRPNLEFHPRFVSTASGGDGYGVWIEYPNSDYLLRPTRAFKQWQEYDDAGRVTLRRTVYYPERIEKQIWTGGGWTAYQPDGEDWPLPWLDRAGKPLGIPLAHFRNPALKSDLYDMIPLQDALNKQWLDILATSDMTGFAMLAFFGFAPTTDGKEPAADLSNALQVAPGQVFGTMKPPGDAAVQKIEPSSTTPLLEVEERIVLRIAGVTDTPVSRFSVTRQIAAENTLKQQEIPLISKANERQTLYGNAWEDAMKLAVRLGATFGGVTLPELAEVSTIWKNPETRDDTQDVENAAKKKLLGVPVAQLLTEIGYTPAEIADFEASPEWQARLAGLNLARVNAEDMGGEGDS